jgi:hypothetical protein
MFFKHFSHPICLLALPPEKEIKLMPSDFTVFVLNRYGDVTTKCKFSGKQIPSTLEEFWHATGVSRVPGATARAVISMIRGWSKLDANPKNTENYKIDPSRGVMFQVSSFTTPTSSPSNPSGGADGAAQLFSNVMFDLFPENPFAFGIPAKYADDALTELGCFFQRPL